MSLPIPNWDGIWDWGEIMTNGMGWDGYGMGFDTNGNWDSPIPISMSGKYNLYYCALLYHAVPYLFYIILQYSSPSTG